MTADPTRIVSKLDGDFGRTRPSRHVIQSFSILHMLAASGRSG